MATRVYLSSLRSRWPIARQEELLDKHLPDWRSGAVFRDVLPPRKRRVFGVEDLEQRTSLLRPTGRRHEETIVTASLANLALTTADLFTVIASLADRGATLRALAEDILIAPEAGAAVLARAAAAYSAALARNTGEGPEKGGKISGERREAAAKARCETIRERWALSDDDYPTSVLLAEADVSRTTAKKHLGKREDAQRARETREAQAERNRARRKQP